MNFKIFLKLRKIQYHIVRSLHLVSCTSLKYNVMCSMLVLGCKSGEKLGLEPVSAVAYRLLQANSADALTGYAVWVSSVHWHMVLEPAVNQSFVRPISRGAPCRGSPSGTCWGCRGPAWRRPRGRQCSTTDLWDHGPHRRSPSPDNRYIHSVQNNAT